MREREESVRRLLLQVRALAAALETHRAAVSHRTHLNRTDLNALELVARRGGLTAGEMAGALHLTTGAVTGVIDRLEAAGHVERVVDAEDRRRVVVAPTAAAHTTSRELLKDLGDAIAEAVSGYTPEERELLTAFLERLEEAVGGHAERLELGGAR